MKRFLVFFVVLVAAVFGLSWIMPRFWQQDKADQVVLDFQAGTESATEGVPTPPPYTGDPIENIGNDPFVQQVPTDYLRKYKQELANFKKTLAENPEDAEGWVRVGVLKKFFNNYEGARDAWEYVKIINPAFSTPYYNLGGLYAGYLKDNPKAEENYLKAIEIDPNLTYFYLALAEFYSVFYKEKIDQVDDILLRGLAALPNNESLLGALRNYKESGVIKE